MIRARNIRIFLEDGTIDGIVSAEVGNWVGQIMTLPRSKLIQLDIKKYEKFGVYFLINQDLKKVYIGETDSISRRLREHDSKKEEKKEKAEENWEWDTICFVMSKDDNLTKSHVRYLENRLIALAKNNEVYTLANGNNGSQTIAQLPRPEVADMMYFLSQIEMVLPVLGLDFLKTGRVTLDNFTRNIGVTSEDKSAVDFCLTTKGIKAYAQDRNGSFVVLKGSNVSPDVTDSSQNNSYIQNLRPSLLGSGIINPESYIFMEDYKFNSPSAAAAIISGGFANGRTMWKLKNDPKISYAKWQDEKQALQVSKEES